MERDLTNLKQLVPHFTELKRIIYKFLKEVKDYVDFISG